MFRLSEMGVICGERGAVMKPDLAENALLLMLTSHLSTTTLQQPMAKFDIGAWRV
jgi:hypothetical protein